jgi:DoxX-like protein
MENSKIVSLLLRIGIAFTFIYAAVQTTLHPNDWIWFFPAFLRNSIPHQLLLTGFSLYEVALSIWLLLGWRLVYASLLAALTILGIIVFNLSTFDIVFRDVTIFFAAAALTVGSYKTSKKKK